MGWLKSLAGIAAPIVGNMVAPGIGGAIGSAVGGAIAGGSKTPGTSATTQQQIDPRMQSILYGANGAEGLLQRLAAQASQGQTPGLAGFGSGMDNYLGGWGTKNFMSSQQAAQRLQGSDLEAPGIAAATTGRAYTNAPSQNSMNLAPAFDGFINGAPGANPYLTAAIQKGINQSSNAFGALQEDSTQNLLENIMPSIRGSAVAAGQFGGSRQGIAEGRALSDFGKQQQRALSQVGQNNTDAAVAAQAGAYDTDRNRSLAALTNLSGQQYQTAAHDADLWQRSMDTNASLWDSANRANQASRLATNALNSSNQSNGIGLSAGLLGQAYGMGNAASNAPLSRMTQVTSALAPFTGYGTSTTQSTPGQSGGAAGILGGAMTGLGLFNQLGGSANGGTNWGSLGSLFGSNGASSFWS